eukprot:748428-Hanusia_phi.AAC.2
MKLLSPPYQFCEGTCVLQTQLTTQLRKRLREKAENDMQVDDQENRAPNAVLQDQDKKKTPQQIKKQRTANKDLVLTEKFITEKDMMQILNDHKGSSRGTIDEFSNILENFKNNCKFAFEVMSNEFFEKASTETLEKEKLQPRPCLVRKPHERADHAKSSTEEGKLEIRKILHADGDRYFGTCLDVQMHGFGSVWYANGDKYVGQLKQNLRHGYGRMLWSDGHIYEGLWKEDLICPGGRPSRDPFGVINPSKPITPNKASRKMPFSAGMSRANLQRGRSQIHCVNLGLERKYQPSVIGETSILHNAETATRQLFTDALCIMGGNVGSNGSLLSSRMTQTNDSERSNMMVNSTCIVILNQI